MLTYPALIWVKSSEGVISCDCTDATISLPILKLPWGGVHRAIISVGKTKKTFLQTDSLPDT